MNIGGINNQGVAQLVSGRQHLTYKRSDPYQNQIKYLQERIEGLKENDTMDPMEKQALLEQYNKQLQDLKTQQAQQALEETVAMAQEHQPKNLASEKENASGGIQEAIGIKEDTQRALIGINSSQQLSKTLSNVRTQKENNRRWALTENFIKKPDPVGAADAASSIVAINRADIKQAMDAVDAIRKDASHIENEQKPVYDQLHRDEKEKQSSGTGRMELGQFLDNEA